MKRILFFAVTLIVFSSCNVRPGGETPGSVDPAPRVEDGVYNVACHSVGNKFHKGTFSVINGATINDSSDFIAIHEQHLDSSCTNLEYAAKTEFKMTVGAQTGELDASSQTILSLNAVDSVEALKINITVVKQSMLPGNQTIADQLQNTFSGKTFTVGTYTITNTDPKDFYTYIYQNNNCLFLPSSNNYSEDKDERTTFESGYAEACK